MGKQWKQWQTIFLGSKITANGDCSHEIKRPLLLGRKAMTNLVSEVSQLCLTLWDPMDSSLPGSSVHGIFQSRILEWVAISFYRRSLWLRDWTRVSHIVGRLFTIWVTKPRQHIKKQIHYFANKGPSCQSYGFSSSHVWMWELAYKESWVLKNWCFWTVVLEKTLESHLDSKEIQPVHPKGNQSWIFIWRTDAEAETPILWPPDGKNWLIWKDPVAEKDWRWEEKGMTEDEIVGWHHQLDGHEFE